MTTNLFQTRSMRSAYNHLLIQIEELKESNPLYPIFILSPSSDAISELQTNLGDTICISIHQFYTLANAILDEAAFTIQEINDIAVRRLIRSILHQMQEKEQIQVFERLIDKPGFIEALINWLREMKSQGIFPKEMQSVVHLQGSILDQHLADFYFYYQEFLKAQHYSDTDGLLWLAAEALEEDETFFQQNGAFFILGFDQFTNVQIRMLKQLADRFKEANIYLTWDANRDQASLVLSRLSKTRNALINSIHMKLIFLPDHVTQSNHLAHLHQHIFESTLAEIIHADQNQIVMVEAPSRTAEVRHALREIKRLLLENIPANKIALVCPNKQTYLPIVRTVSTEFGIPVDFEHPLLQNPAISALINVLKLPFEFPWQLTLQTLRSPYILQPWLSLDHINLLEVISRDNHVIAGIDQWLRSLEPLNNSIPEYNSEDYNSKRLVFTLEEQTLTKIKNGLNTFFQHLTPPKKASIDDYIAWLQSDVIGIVPDSENEEEISSSENSLNIHLACQQSPFAQRDLQALSFFMQTLRSLHNASVQIPSKDQIFWQDFRDELISLVSTMEIPSDSTQNSISFDRLEAGRARTFDYLFVLGLSEGEFPSPPPVDPFYTQQERQDHPLSLIKYNLSDQVSLWWQLIGNVNKKLTLLRPYLDENGAPWQASPYWEKVRDCFTNLEPFRIPIADHPMPKDAACLTELLTALIKTEARTIPPQLEKRYRQINYAKVIQNQRLSYLPAGNFEGVLGKESIKKEIIQEYGNNHIWSPSQLNQYGNCPFQFFAQRILKIDALKDPEEGFDSLQRGSLLHAILEHVYRRLTELDITPSIENQNKILEVLDSSCDSIFFNAPERFGFHPSPLWKYEQEEIRRLLKALIQWDCEENDKINYEPFLQEACFGFSSQEKPVLVIQNEQSHLELRGKIDRIDRNAKGELRIIDYKSGSTKYSVSAIRQASALQTVLYALAAEELWLEQGSLVKTSLFWHIPIKDYSGKLDFKTTVKQNDTVKEALQRIFLHLGLIQQAYFPSKPADTRQCRQYCDYAALCRVNRQSIAKAKQGDLS